ncbi:MAG: aminotransferase class V-fold PLP-dependent enzyme [Cyclobacteriaceae bacterium]
MNTENLRAQTPGCAYRTHFNNAGSSLMPAPVLEAMTSWLNAEAETGGYEIAELCAKEVAGFYESGARLLNARPDNLAFTSSATNAFARALSSIPFAPGDVILIANEDYISNQIAFLSVQKRYGIKLVRAESDKEGGVDVQDLERKIIQYKPRLVSLSHVPTNSGLVQPAEAVGALCRAHGCWYLLDACQSVGQLPVDVQQLQCDFLTATYRKFLRGPRGAGFLYVSDRALKAGLEPLFVDMRGAAWKDADHYELRPDARRFEDWELPYALVMGARAAMDYALDIGLDAIALRNAGLCARVRKGLVALGLSPLDHGRNLSSIITVTVPGWDPVKLKKALLERRINTSITYREFAVIDFGKKNVDWALRLSPHYFNTDEEVDQLLLALKEIL